MSTAFSRTLYATAARRSVSAAWPSLTGAPAVRQALVCQRRAGSSLPTITQPSFWRSMIPKPLRRSEGGGAAKLVAANARAAKRQSQSEWNPATFYIVIFVFIGSMAIQMITIKKDFDTYMRRSEVKIGLLREVVERIQKGEDVDVAQVLGTGVPEQEAEWDAVLKELARDDPSRNPKRTDKKADKDKIMAATPVAATPVAEPSTVTKQPEPTGAAPTPAPAKVATITSFY